MTRLVRLLAVILVAGFAAHGVAAQVSGVPRVGLLHWPSPEMGRLSAGEFREGVRSLGWIEGSTISIEDRFADGNPARLSAYAAEFVAASIFLSHDENRFRNSSNTSGASFTTKMLTLKMRLQRSSDVYEAGGS